MTRGNKGIIQERAAALVMLPEVANIDTIQEQFGVSMRSLMRSYSEFGGRREQSAKTFGMGVPQFVRELGIRETYNKEVHRYIIRGLITAHRVGVYDGKVWSIDLDKFVDHDLPRGLCWYKLFDPLCNGDAGTAIWRDILQEARAAFLAAHISLAQVNEVFCWSYSSVVRGHQKSDGFPRPIALRARHHCWFVRCEVAAWVLEHPRYISPAVAREFGL